MSERKLPTIPLFGLQFYSGSKSSLIDQIHILLDQKLGLPLIIFTPNPEQIVQLKGDTQFAGNLQKADVLLPDGAGIVLTAKLKGHKLERLAGIDLMQEVFTSFRNEEKAVIGGRYNPGKIGELSAYEWHKGYEDIRTPQPEEESSVRAWLKEKKPLILFVAFGAPWQEQWVIAHHNLLKESGVKVVMVIGGAFDVLSGRLQRAPKWMQNLNLEWLYRLLQEPWRWKRQLRLVAFLPLMVQEILQKK